MPRSTIGYLLRVGGVLLLCGSIGATARAQLVPLPKLELIRAMTARNLPEQSLDVLHVLGTFPTLPPELAAVLPLETARATLVLAENVHDSVRQAELYAQAQKDFDRFLEKPWSPALAEAARFEQVRALAGIARAHLAKALESDNEARGPALLEVRAEFQNVAKRLLACKEADLDQARNLLDEMRTFDPRSQAAERQHQGKLAIAELQRIAGENAGHAQGYLARAWIIKCCNEMGQYTEAGEAFRRACGAFTTVALVGADGAPLEPAQRMARAFYVQTLLRHGADDEGSLRELIDQGSKWLEHYRTFSTTGEGIDIVFGVAEAARKLAGKVQEKQAAPLLRQADHCYRQLTLTKNPYADRARAARQRLAADDRLPREPDEAPPSTNNSLEGAKKILSTLAVDDGLAPVQRKEVKRIRALVDAGKYDEADTALGTLVGGLPAGVRSKLLQIARAECMVAGKTKIMTARADLGNIIYGNADPTLRRLAFNAIGECCLKNEETGKALYNFLYVELVFNQDRDEVRRARRNTVKVFRILKDEVHALQYQDLVKLDERSAP